MGKAVIHVSTKLLSHLLKLPEGYIVDSVHASSSFFNRDGLSFFISSDKIPEGEEGEEYPVVVPTYSIDETGRVQVAEIKLIS